MRGRLDATAAGQQQIVALLQTIASPEGPQATDYQYPLPCVHLHASAVQ